MHILEEFWYGNINPMERPFQKQRGFDKAFRMLTKNEEKLIETLNEQEKELFDKFKACYDEMIEIRLSKARLWEKEDNKNSS